MELFAFDAKTQEVLAGKTTMLATSSKFAPPSNAIGLNKTPGEDCAKRTLINGGLGASFGLFYGAIEVAWYPDPILDFRGRNVDATPMRAIIGKVIQPCVLLGVAATTYTLAECTIESTRQSKDAWNAVYAGMLTGFIVGGLTRKRFDTATACALGTGLFMGLADLCGPGMNWNKSHGIKKDSPAVLPKTHVESPELAALKEMYPKFKDL